MNSSVGKILHEKNEITPDDVSMPAKRMTGTRVSNMNNSLIGGQAPQGDPYLTTAQMMNSGEGTEKKLGSKKKILNEFQPELFVSPITGEQIADYGTWVDDIKNKTVKPKEEPEEDPYKNDPIMGKLKAQLSMRGAKGIIGLGRLFKIMDDDRSNSLSFAEFKKAMKDFGMVLNDTELVVLFKRFDISKSGAISYNDFLTTIAGSLNNRRRTLVNLAYDVLDKDGSGEIDISDIAMAYDASKHPDVVSGKRTTEQVLIEFLDGFDVGGTKDGKVTREEFERYYVTISASIDRDDYFELMIRNAWHISGGEGAAANSSNLRVLAVLADGTQTVVEVKNDLGLNKKDKNAILARLKAQGVNAINISTFDGGDDNQKGGPKPPPSRAGSRAGQRSAANPNSPNRKNRSNTNDAVNRSAEPSAGLKLIIAKIKQEMKSRGSGGFVGLQRRFKIMDDDGSKSLSISEFKKALKEFKMDISESDYRLLFDHFDRDQSGTIDFEEFVQGVRDPLNDKRLALVHLAFSVLDKDGSGIVDGQEIASMYDASKHPEVMAKRRTAAQVLREFLDTFDVGGVKDGKVTREEFVNYYTNIGASIENDEYFELMIRNAWHLNGGEGAAGNSTNMKVLITNTKGQEVTVALNNDLGVKKDDIPKIYARLRSQGVTDIYAIFGKVIKVLNINGVDVVTIQGETSSLNNDTAVAPNVLRAPPISRSRPQTAGGRVGSSTPMQRPVAGADSMPMGGANANNLRTNTTALAGNVVSQLKHQRESNAKKTADNIIGNTLLDVLRVQLLSRGTAGIIDLQRKFVEMDSDGSKSLDIGEFRAALLNNNMSFSDEQIESLFNYLGNHHMYTFSIQFCSIALIVYLDRDHSGFIDYQELLEGVRVRNCDCLSVFL